MRPEPPARPAIILAAFGLGRLSLRFLVAFAIIPYLHGIGFSVAALMLEEFSYRRRTCPTGRDVATVPRLAPADASADRLG
jgi:hypothetical protein